MKSGNVFLIFVACLLFSTQTPAQETSFPGTGRESPDTNLLISYPALTEEYIEYRLGGPRHFVVDFAPEIDPSSFSATLNGRDISARFKARPGTRRNIYLHLKPGENMLDLHVASVKDDKTGAVRWDDDQFVVELRNGMGVGAVMTEPPAGLVVVPVEGMLGLGE